MLNSIRLIAAALLILTSAFPSIVPAWAAREPNEIPLYAGGFIPEQRNNKLFVEGLIVTNITWIVPIPMCPTCNHARLAILKFWRSPFSY